MISRPESPIIPNHRPRVGQRGGVGTKEQKYFCVVLQAQTISTAPKPNPLTGRRIKGAVVARQRGGQNTAEYRVSVAQLDEEGRVRLGRGREGGAGPEDGKKGPRAGHMGPSAGPRGPASTSAKPSTTPLGHGSKITKKESLFCVFEGCLNRPRSPWWSPPTGGGKMLGRDYCDPGAGVARGQSLAVDLGDSDFPSVSCLRLDAAGDVTAAP